MKMILMITFLVNVLKILRVVMLRLIIDLVRFIKIGILILDNATFV